MRTLVRKLTPELRSEKNYIFFLLELAAIIPVNWHGVSPKEQELPFFQPGVSYSEPCRHRLQFGDFHFDWADV